MEKSKDRPTFTFAASLNAAPQLMLQSVEDLEERAEWLLSRGLPMHEFGSTVGKYPALLTRGVQSQLEPAFAQLGSTNNADLSDKDCVQRFNAILEGL